MTKSTYTPSPWAYDEDDARIYYDDGNVQPTIAYVERDGVSPAQVKADGYLLALSPKLLHALRGIAAIIGDSRRIAGYHLNGDVADWDEF